MSPSKRRFICGYSILAACVVAGSLVRAEDEPKKTGFLGRIADLVKKKEEAPPPPAPEEKPKAEEKPKTTSKPKSTSTAKSKSGGTTSKKTAGATSSKKSTSKPAASESKSETKADVAKKGASPAAGKDDSKPAAKETKPDAKSASTKEKPASSEPTSPTDGKEKTKDASDKVPAVAASKPTSPPSPSAESLSVDPPGRPMGGFAPGDERALDVTSSNRTDTVTSSASKLTEPPESSGIINPLPTGKNGGWEVVKSGGRDYVTGDSILNFYRVAGLSTYKFTAPHVWFRGNNLIIKAQVGSMELLINNVKFILSYPVIESGGKALFSRLDLCKLIDPVLRPSYITGADPFDTVVLDAGHGGHDSGAKGVYGYEKDFALKMALVVKASLEKRGFKVVMTRSTDEFISRTGRVAIANKTPNSIFISLHFNSAGPTATGIETFALTPTGGSASLERGGGYNSRTLTGNQQDSENIALATAVHARVVSTYKLIDRGIKRAQWTVLTGCNRPGILFEGGFVTNGSECRLIASDTYRKALAETIGDAVVNYRKALQPPSMVRKSPYGR